jgi:transcriptional regulator with XRE-family HTH domain
MIGEQIATLQKRKGVSQRELVTLVNVSQPTLIDLER